MIIERPLCPDCLKKGIAKPMMKKEKIGGTVKEPMKRNKQVWKCCVCQRTRTLPIQTDSLKA